MTRRMFAFKLTVYTVFYSVYGMFFTIINLASVTTTKFTDNIYKSLYI